MNKYNFVHIVWRHTWALCLQISPAIEKTRSDGLTVPVALTANMAFCQQRQLATSNGHTAKEISNVCPNMRPITHKQRTDIEFYWHTCHIELFGTATPPRRSTEMSAAAVDPEPPPPPITLQVETGGLKTRDWKRRDGRKCNVGKRSTGKCGTKLQGWKTREWKTRHQSVGVENARLANAGPKLQGGKLGKRPVWTAKCYCIRCCSNI